MTSSILPHHQPPDASPITVLPSLLSADPLRLGDEISALIQAGITMVHLDIMDHHYVPNLTFGPHIAAALRQHFPTLGIDVHLMTKPVDALIETFAKAGATRISIHPDATLHLDRSLQLIQSFGCQSGLVLNPATPIDMITWCLHRLDFILVMTVNPGFGGQTLIPEVLPKIKTLRKAYPHLPICVDGGVSPSNIHLLARAGVTECIVGHALFSHANYQKTIQSLAYPEQH